ncbi:MAG: glutathione S- transferase, nitrogen catabolite repression regulator [Ramalina farinacea]|uniref:Glutathione S- transferase, nitrogen catabolite repression regulator n=1 Tax=Ramalina farinacea TaxID=258253 RepID=A0AA43U1J2_9LECA|nr:glutathione S- transferase, nitrogen catabolite repression regulator [Ramalina farinacea]
MSTSMKPIKVWGEGGPNPPKVGFILEELALSYETVRVALSDVKGAEYVAINPNGRLPAIYDPNTDITLWESDAILEYIIERYDTDHKLSFAPGTPEYYYTKQWLFFQASGQGPYYGQVVWFIKYHPEPQPSALKRYVDEINRVTGVLEGQLARQKEKYGAAGDGPWLVGDKFSVADLAFIPWQAIVSSGFIGKEDFDPDRFGLVKEWLGKMMARETIKKVSIAPPRGE